MKVQKSKEAERKDPIKCKQEQFSTAEDKVREVNERKSKYN